MKQELSRKTLDIAESAAAIGRGILIGGAARVLGSEIRDQYAGYVIGEARFLGRAPWRTRLPFAFYPTSERREVTRQIKESLQHYLIQAEGKAV